MAIASVHGIFITILIVIFSCECIWFMCTYNDAIFNKRSYKSPHPTHGQKFEGERNLQGVDKEKRLVVMGKAFRHDSETFLTNSTYDGREHQHLKFIWLKSTVMKRILSRELYKEFIDLFRTLDQAFTEANITYVMSDGTLLGSYLCHGMIPWDDDGDLMVDIADRPKVHFVLGELNKKGFAAHGYHDENDEYAKFNCKDEPRQKESKPTRRLWHKFKFYKCDHRLYKPVPKLHYNWPFLDIKYFENDISSEYIRKKDFTDGIVQLKKWGEFYPLYRRPYGPLWLPSPRDTLKYLRLKYLARTNFTDIECKTKGWDHIKENWRHTQSANCDLIRQVFPGVSRKIVKSDNPRGTRSVLETLTLNGTVLHTVEVKGQTDYHFPAQSYSLI
ncbi:unnamed protein product [Owenia fusiformis]|uniref:LicD/FKTN/FKRP nucleotidyltransferase domain-containing protein n=1 Tax=Owenia fusiformis TaxID=6347 RepID=A0A8S4P9U6_OWEFU|nr:unnamed protein product [Owenia fusiformis]